MRCVKRTADRRITRASSRAHLHLNQISGGRRVYNDRVTQTALRLVVLEPLHLRLVHRLGVVVQRPARVDDVHGDADRDGHGRPLEVRDSVGEAAQLIGGYY